MLNIGQFLSRRAVLDPDKVGVIAGDQRLTYHALNARANQAAHALAARGVGRGDRVAVLLRNGLEYHALYFGLAKLGAVLCGINWRLAPSEVAYIVENCGARLLIYDAEFADGVARVRERLPPDVLVAGAAAGPAERRLDEILGAAPEHEPAIAGEPDDPLVLMYTSGTTGRPKGAVLTHQQMFWTSATIVYTLDHRRDDVNLLPLPLYHVGGLSFITAFAHLGSTVVMIRAWDAAHVLELIGRERIHHFMAVPSMLNELHNLPGLAQADLSSLRWLLVAAAPVPPGLIHAFAECGIVVQQSYGMTETGGPATVVGREHAIAKAGSAGLPFFHTEVRVVDEGGAEAAPGEVGEIWVRGPHVISSYWQDPAATAAAFVDGWLRSGDLAYRDADGYLYIVGRRTDMIISGGENVYPAEVENVLNNHPKLMEVAVVGVPDPTWGETVCAVAVVRPGEALDLDELRSFCEGKLARYKLPRKLIVSAQPLPRNATGKLLKSALRRWLEENYQ